MKQRQAKPGGLEKAPTRGREQGKGPFWFYCKWFKRARKEGRRARDTLGRRLVSKPLKMALVRTRRRGCFLVPVSRPPPQETSLCFYGDFSFLVLGEVPFSAFTTPFSW